MGNVGLFWVYFDRLMGNALLLLVLDIVCCMFYAVCNLDWQTSSLVFEQYQH
eukprot:COSAG06_NODE_1772_length_8428_cov_8.827710_2_plen_52_part_00